jgi:hypothetical protein
MSQMTLLANGVSGASGQAGLQINTAAANSLGSDESLGGALLTPIPWLARRANGGGSEDGAASSEDGSASSPITAPTTAAGASEQEAAQPQPDPAAEVPQPQPQTQPQLQIAPAAAEDSSPSIRTESTETIEGPNGIGSIETVSVSVNGIPSTGAAVLASRGVTQGELLRQEQRAGVVPLSQLVRQAQQQQLQQQQQAQAQASAATNDAEAEEERASNAEAAQSADAGMDGVVGGPATGEEEIPHARGPSEIDDVDTGPQAGSGGATHLAVGSTSASGQPVVKMQGIDVEAAVGRRTDGSSLRASSPEAEKKARKTSPEQAAAAEDAVPRSPKREAEEGLDRGEGKKAKVGDNEAAESEDVVMGTDKRAGEDGAAAAGADAQAKPETDAEGDVVIRDQALGEGEGDETAAGS